MPTRTEVWDEIQVIGYIWMPDNVLCAQTIRLRPGDLESISAIGNGKLSGITREDIEIWLTSHTGDFSHVVDFAADFGTIGRSFNWDKEDSAEKFFDCMIDRED